MWKDTWAEGLDNGKIALIIYEGLFGLIFYLGGYLAHS
jgi:hypothetical protein